MSGAMDTRGLHIGGAYCFLNGLQESQINGLSIRGDVQKAEHRTSEEVMFKRDFVLPIEESLMADFNFDEFTPRILNTLMGKPGYHAVPIDQSLANPFAAPFQFTHDPRLDVQKVEMLDRNTIPQLQYLKYSMANTAATARTPFRAGAVQNVSAKNPAVAAAYVGFYAGIRVQATSVESAMSPVMIIDHNSANADATADAVLLGDRIVMRLQLEPDHIAGDRIRIYRYEYTKNAATGEFIGTAVVANALYSSPGTGAPQSVPQGWAAAQQAYYEIQAGDVTQGYAEFSVFARTATTLALAAGLPVNPIASVKSLDGGTTYDWLDDYNFIGNYKSGSGIRRVSTGDILTSQVVEVTYYWDAAGVAQMPIGSQLPRNPIIPITFKIPFPDGASFALCHLHRGQVRSSWNIGMNEGNWTNVPFSCDALDASDEFPNSPFGYWQFGGPLATRITELGNVGALQLGETWLDALLSSYA